MIKSAPIELQPGDLLTAKEAAELLGLSAITLANWRSQRKGPRYHKVGARAVRYLRADLAAFIGDDVPRAAA